MRWSDLQQCKRVCAIHMIRQRASATRTYSTRPSDRILVWRSLSATPRGMHGVATGVIGAAARRMGEWCLGQGPCFPTTELARFCSARV